MIRLALTLLLLLSLPARGEELVAGLSQTQVSLTANFEGSEILVFGAIRREAPIPDDALPLEVIVTIAGPAAPLTVWRKARRAGIWVNVDGVRVSSAPSFYAVATSGPFVEVLSATEDLRHRVSVPRAIRAVGAASTVPDAPVFTEALIRIREQDGRYTLLEDSVEITRETLFRTSISLPASLIEGEYATRILLTRGGRVLDVFETGIEVRKGGLARWLFALARDWPLLYGLLAVVLAAAAGWGASAAFRYART